MDYFADVSSYNSVKSWQDYGKWSQIVSIKLTEGKDYTDPVGLQSARGCEPYVHNRLFYHFARFGQWGRSAKDEAHFFVDTARKAGFDPKRDALVCDLEWCAKSYPNALNRRQYGAFCTEVRSIAKVPVLGTYTGEWWWGPHMGQQPVREWGWISAYVNFDQFDHYKPAAFVARVVAQQFTDGKFGPEPHGVPGVSGICDVSRLMVPLDQFRRQIGLESGPVPKPKPPAPAPPVAAPKYPGSPLRRGTRGYSVQLIQRRLRIATDGVFGRQTEAAVRSFQTSRKIAVDGVVGPLTWRLMFG